MKVERSAINPRRGQDYPEWYQQVIRAADLAEISSVRGCMVIKPWGYALWENMQKTLDRMIKKSGHRNAYFPLFIPLRFFEKEAEHVESFAKECAVVTHSRLQADGKGHLIPASPLEEPLIVRPTSETIIGESFANWVKSYRDLPLKINQWANVVRWEMRTRLFLRTSEFLWQEGHTVHSSPEEAIQETLAMLEMYRVFAEDHMAMPVICGKKSDSERFPGAVDTYCIEAMMQDRKALQAGTSHFLGQNFARASHIKFVNGEGVEEYGWTTSWGVSTRLIGGLIMAHSDDDGLVLPPKLAPVHAVILPIFNESNKSTVLEYCGKLKLELEGNIYNFSEVAVEIDDRDLRGGEKFWSYVKKGVPVIVEIGVRDIEANCVCFSRRDGLKDGKQSCSRDTFVATFCSLLDDIQSKLFNRAMKYRDENVVNIDSEPEFFEYFKDSGGFASAHWNGDRAIEERVKKELGVTIRCLPLGGGEGGVCPFSGKESKQRAIWAKSY
ncbi:MAG: proline--tRNA ligase [Puniceicoccales bacterium]|jgi:prolyl-tRNA synthetase|nr:proline--tRNA ligase [Puniceicoccales bacterium]